MNVFFDWPLVVMEMMFGQGAASTALAVVVTAMATWLWCYRSMGIAQRAERAHRNLLREVLQSLKDLERSLKDEGQMTRDGMHFQDIQARIQAAINKSMSNGLAVEKMATRLEAVHAGICKALRTLRREVVDEVESFVQTLKSDMEGHNLGVSHNLQKNLLATLDKNLEKLGDKIRGDITACISDSQKNSRTDMNGIQKLLTAMGSTLQDKFNEVMRELARAYDKNNKEHRETRDVIAWVQQQCEYMEHRTDHLPERLTILRDKIDDLGRNIDQVRARLDPPTQQEGDGQASPPHGGSPPPPPAQQQQWVPPATGAAPTLLHLDESLPMAMGTRSILMPVTLPDGRVLCVPRTVIAQLLGGTM